MDLLEYKTQAFRVLNGLMDSFSDEDGEEEFICPLLEYFWPRLNESLLPNNGLEGVLVLQDWGNSKQSSRAAKANVKHAPSARVLDRQQSDPTLFNLFRSESNWRKPLLEGGWIAMNAVWGTRLSEDAEETDKNKCLPNKIHYPAFAIWGRIIRDLHLNCAFKQLVLAGAWARFETQDEVDRRLSGRK